MQQLFTPTTYAPQETADFIWRPGPHLDLFLPCERVDCEYDDMLRDCLLSAILSGCEHKRVESAKQVLEKTKGASGVAWIVLSREGASSAQAALNFANTVVNCFKAEFGKYDRDVQNARTNSLYIFAQADVAGLLWNEGKREEAIDLSLKVLQEKRRTLWNSRELLRDLVVSYLIQCDRDDEARNMLSKEPKQDWEQWHYLNALLLYRRFGDDLIPRSALAAGMDISIHTARMLLTNKIRPDYPMPSEYFMFRYCDDIKPAWRKSPGAMEWLKKQSSDPLGRFDVNVETMPIAEKPRYKRWSTYFDRAHQALHTNNRKDAVKSLRSSVREAVQISCSHIPFEKTMRYLVEDNSTVDGLVALEELLRTRAEIVERQCSGLNPADALQYESLGAMFANIGEHPRAIKYLSKALDLFEKHIEQKNPAITLTDSTQTTLQLALAMSSGGKKGEATAMLLDELDKFESFLGPNHNEVHIVLEALMTWAHDIQDFDRAKLLHDRVIAIEKEVESSLQQRTTPKPVSCPPECDKYIKRPELKK